MRRASAHKTSSVQAVYTLRVEREKLDALRLIAEMEHRSLTGKLRQMIDDEIARADREPVEPRAAA